MKKIVAVVLAVGFATPALAGEFQVVLDATGRCTVVDKKDVSPQMTLVGNRKVFQNRKRAEDGMKSIRECKSN